MKLSREESGRRWEEILELLPGANDNPIMHRFATAYAMGDIITKQECLAQAVRALREENANLKSKLIDHPRATTPTFIVPKDSLPLPLQ